MFELQPPVDDGLYTPVVGSWSLDKHHFLRRYIDIFTTGMTPQGWVIHYVDLFASAGVENVESYGLDWGSPLIAAQAPREFARLHLCELDRKRFSALTTRLAKFPQPADPQLICGDSNKVVSEIVDAIPLQGTLSLAFLDPYGLHLHFETLRTLATRRMDLIIFFPDHLDALRNWENVYAGRPDSNLDRVLGSPWLERMMRRPREHWAAELRKIYVDQIRTLGYHYFEYERIAMSKGAPLYQLIFCSKHKRGGDFWRKIASRKADGQTSFDFDAQ